MRSRVLSARLARCFYFASYAALLLRDLHVLVLVASGIVR